MRDINKKFSVKYFLNLVLMDTEDRRYFKQQEITLWRKADKSRKSQSQPANNPHVPTHLVGGPDNELSSSKHNSLLGVGGHVVSGDIDVCPTTGGITSPNISAVGGDGHQTTDPRMGLFTRESPIQESKPITIIASDIEYNKQQAQQEQNLSATKKEDEVINVAPTSLPISAEMQRGTADGASSQSDGLIEESVGGSLFDGNPPQVNANADIISESTATSSNAPPLGDESRPPQLIIAPSASLASTIMLSASNAAITSEPRVEAPVPPSSPSLLVSSTAQSSDGQSNEISSTTGINKPVCD